MKRVFAVVMTVVLLLSSVLALSACSSKDEGRDINAFYVSSLYDFDPSLTIVDDDAVDVFNLLYEPLFVMNEKGKVEKSLADKYEIDEENNTMTIVLRETYWSDGIAVSNEDVMFAWQRILDPNKQNPAAALLYDIKNAVDIKHGQDENGNTVTVSDIGITLKGADTLIIEFEDKEMDYDAFLRNLTSIALTPLREDIVSPKDEYWAKRRSTMVTNGPFSFGYIDYDTGTFTLARNKYYNRDPEKNSSVMKYVTPASITTSWYGGTQGDNFLSYESFDLSEISLSRIDRYSDVYKEWLDLALDQFEKDTLFYVGELSLEARKEYKESKLLTLSDTMSTYTYVMNCSVFPKEVRAALSSVIDRNYIVNEITTFGHAATGFISGGVFNADNRKEYFRETADETAKLIDTAEVTDETVANARAAIRACSAFDRTKTYIIKCRNTEEDMAIAKYVSEQWAKVGVNTLISVMSYTVSDIDDGERDKDGKVVYTKLNRYDLQQDYVSGNYDIIAIDYQMLSTDAWVSLASFSTNYNGNGCDLTVDPVTQLSKSELRGHSSGYANAELDKLIDAAYKETNPDKRAEILHSAEAMLIDDMPVIPIMFNQNYYLTHKKLKKVDTEYYHGFATMTKAKLTAKIVEVEEETEE